MNQCLECGNEEFYSSSYTEEGYVVETNVYCKNCNAFIYGDSYGYVSTQYDDLEDVEEEE